MARLLPLSILAILVACQSFPTGDDPNGIEGMSAQRGGMTTADFGPNSRVGHATR